ncbi:MAG: hypothetical protein HQ557_07450 [Bacteroidetes bacterium]|nr:hypothetical protein [Bacteroidota bacterium]
MRERKQIDANQLFRVSILTFALVTVLTAVMAPSLVKKYYPLPPDPGAAWYGWQLAAGSTAARISYWLGFALHFSTVLYIGYRGKGVKPAKRGGITKYNLLMFIVNLFFVLLHMVQTYFWYDGLAKDVPVWSSQGSVIVMLILILYLMVPKRGLFWGKSFKPPQRMLKFIRTWHGPYIALALIYTFWFHPMDGNWGLLSGFVYMFLLFIQLILFNTKIHFNRAWIVLLEFGVAIHGTLITVYKDMEIWPMFMFGFLAMFFLTQLFTWKIPTVWKWLSLGAFIVSILLVYGFIRGFEHIYEVLFIPTALYGGAAALLGIGYLWEKITSTRTGAS